MERRKLVCAREWSEQCCLCNGIQRQQPVCGRRLHKRGRSSGKPYRQLGWCGLVSIRQRNEWESSSCRRSRQRCLRGRRFHNCGKQAFFILGTLLSGYSCCACFIISTERRQADFDNTRLEVECFDWCFAISSAIISNDKFQYIHCPGYHTVRNFMPGGTTHFQPCLLLAGGSRKFFGR